jgi:hypothetical protein
MRIIISTQVSLLPVLNPKQTLTSCQEPTVLPPVLIDLCSCLIMHRFSSKRWYDHLLGHIAADMPDDAFAQLVSLKVRPRTRFTECVLTTGFFL